MAEETTPQAAPEQDAPQAAETPQTEETTQEAAAATPTANNAKDFLKTSTGTITKKELTSSKTSN